MLGTDVLSFADIKDEPFIREHILWDKEPKDLMEPKRTLTDNGLKVRDAIKGYVFYIDTMGKDPCLYLMRHTAGDYGETLAKIEEIPAGLITEAIEEHKDRIYFGMYPITKKIEQWLRREMGMQES